MASGINNFADSDDDGLRIIVSAGMGQREIEFPDATSYIQNGNELRVGTGKVNSHHNYLKGETFGSFNWNNVVAILRM